MKPFNLERAKAGATVQTRAGSSARILCFDRDDATYPIVALINNKDLDCYTLEGKFSTDPGRNVAYDLVMNEQKQTRYINVYIHDYIEARGHLFDTPEQAEEARDNQMLPHEHYIATVTWEE